MPKPTAERRRVTDAGSLPGNPAPPRSGDLFRKLRTRLQFVLYGLYACLFSSKTVKVSSGQTIKIETGTSHEAFRAFTFFSKEPETLAWIDGFVACGNVDSPVFFDIGANIGIYSLYVAATIPGATVVSFEPESQSFASLCRNVRLNWFSNITPYLCALSNEAALGTLHISTMSAGAGAAALGEDYQYMKVAKHEIVRQGVFVASLDHLVFDLGLPFPDYVKIDVDGIERKILLGGGRVLSDERLKGLLVELQYESDADVWSLSETLMRCGLKLIGKSDWEACGPGGLQSRNFIFQRVGGPEGGLRSSSPERGAYGQ